MDRWGNRYDRDRWDDERGMWNRHRNRAGYDDRDYDRARDIGWRGTELDRGFSGRYEYDRGYDRGHDRDFDRGYHRDFDRGYDREIGRGYDRDRDVADRLREGWQRMTRPVRDWDRDRDFERDRDRDFDRDRDYRFRDREYGGDYWDNYPWSRGRGW